VQYLVGGYVMEDVSLTLSLLGGDAGGVSGPRKGTGPGEHTGICLFGTAMGVPRVDVLRVRCGGGVVERPGMASVLATTAAMVANGGGYGVKVQLKARSVDEATSHRKEGCRLGETGL